MSLVSGEGFAIEWSTVLALRWLTESELSKQRFFDQAAKNVGRKPTPPTKKRSLRVYMDLPLSGSTKEFVSVPFVGKDADLLWTRAIEDKAAFKVIEEIFAVRTASIRAIVSTGPNVPLQLIVVSHDGRAKPLSLDAALISQLLLQLRDVS